MKILNFGSCNLDYVYALDHIVAPGETEASATMNIFPGGKGLNQSIAVARAGVEIYHAGVLGSDGGLLLQTMEQSGVKTQHIQRVPEKNGHAIIQVTAAGENSIILHAGSNAMLTEKMIDSVLEHFRAGDVLMLQNEVNLVGHLVEKAHAKGMVTVLNPSPFNDKIKEIDLRQVSWLLLNEVEAAGLTGSTVEEDSIRWFQQNLPETKVLLTLGKQGCVLIGEGRCLRQRAFQVEAVDTTAAGDTFTGYFVASVSRGLPWEECLLRATAAAAICVTRHGAAPSIPWRIEIDNFLQANC